MINELIKQMGKNKEVAILMAISIAAFTWGVQQLGLGPMAINSEISKAEMRSKAYIDEKTAYGEKIVDMKHTEVMNAIKRLDNSVEGLRLEIREIYRDQNTATIKIPKGDLN